MAYVMMRCADFLIYTYTKFLLKILFLNESLMQLGIYHAFISVGEGEGRENIWAFQYIISCAGEQCEDQKGASVLLLAAFKVCACMCRVCSVMRLK